MARYADVEKLEKWVEEFHPNDAYWAISMLRNAPDANVEEVKHGHWMFEFTLDNSNFYRCSLCGRQESLLTKESPGEYFPYCHCGAKMDEVMEITKEQQVELCRIYNNSDMDAFVYMKQFCNAEQLELLERLIVLNSETDLGCGREPSTAEEEDEYYNSKWTLLNSFGIENRNGDGYFEDKFYN